MLPDELACYQTTTLAEWILQGFIPVNTPTVESTTGIAP